MLSMSWKKLVWPPGTSSKLSDEDQFACLMLSIGEGLMQATNHQNGQSLCIFNTRAQCAWHIWKLLLRTSKSDQVVLALGNLLVMGELACTRTLEFFIQLSVVSQDCLQLTPSLSLQVQARNSGSAWDQEVPEVHRAIDQEAAFPEAGPWDCSGLQDWPEVSIKCCTGSPGGSWGLLGWPVWGHQPGSHPCQESHHHAQGHSACSPHQRRESLNSVTYHTTPGDLNHHHPS